MSSAPENFGQIRPDEMDDRIREILQDRVAAMFRAHILEMFGSINTTMMEYFDEQYAALTEAASTAAIAAVFATGLGAGRVVQYRDFDNTKPLLLMGFRIPSRL